MIIRRIAPYAAAAVLLAAGGAASLAHADDPAPTVTVTKTTTVSVERTVQGRNVRWWSRRAVQARKDANARARTVARLRRVQARTWRPTVSYAIRLASRVYGVPEPKMWAVARCESTLSPFAVNGRYKGLFQLGWSPFGFSPFDPVASALSTAQTVTHDGSWRQWECG